MDLGTRRRRRRRFFRIFLDDEVTASSVPSGGCVRIAFDAASCEREHGRDSKLVPSPGPRAVPGVLDLRREFGRKLPLRTEKVPNSYPWAWVLRVEAAGLN